MLISDVSRLLFREECLHLGSMVMINDQLGGKRVRFDGNPVGDESLQKKIPACPSCSPAHTNTKDKSLDTNNQTYESHKSFG